jgi:hypothetical protein
LAIRKPFGSKLPAMPRFIEPSALRIEEIGWPVGCLLLDLSGL